MTGIMTGLIKKIIKKIINYFSSDEESEGARMSARVQVGHK